jgi:pimeloyl-ACP methyl ester carboxylesterase
MHRPNPFFRVAALAVLVSAGLSAAACGNNGLTNPTPTDPTPPTLFTETFEGTVTVNGAITHPFVAQRAGTATARLSALEPDAAAVVGLSLGTWNGAVCDIKLANDVTTVSDSVANVTATATTTGNFCVRIYDVGRLSAAASYQIIVTHY